MGFDTSTGMDWKSIVFLIFVGLFTVLFLVLILYGIVQGVRQWSKNNASPTITIPAEVVAKRTETNTHRSNNPNNNAMAQTTSSTLYFVTFEFETEERKEWQVAGEEYGLLVEGDEGTLTFQGTRFKGFKRKIEL